MNTSSNIKIVGIPYDEKSSFIKGCAKAPNIIRKFMNSKASNSFAENGLDINSDLITDVGDLSVNKYFDIEKRIAHLLENDCRILTIGGDHSITYPIVKAYNKHFPSFEVLHIDAHADLYDNYGGDKYSHACPFARIMEENLTDRLVQVGIRTLNTHQREQSAKFKTEIIEMKDLYKSKALIFNKPVYLSIDLDGLDPAHAPGVSHQEPGGLSTRELITIIQNINMPIIGADIVEYNPINDVNNVTAILCAKLMKEILSKML